METEKEDSIECQIERIKAKIKQSELYAQWWIARAVTGEIKNHKIWHGYPKDDANLFTDDEKIKDAIDTAAIHIKSIEEMTEILIDLMQKKVILD